jgi:hypothetical protein
MRPYLELSIDEIDLRIYIDLGNNHLHLNLICLALLVPIQNEH